MKNCSKCGTPKPPEAFYRRGAGRQNQCIECSKSAAKEWYAANPEYRRTKAKDWRQANPDYVREYRKTNRRDIYLTESARKYGITREQFAQMLERQSEKCATCFRAFDWDDKQAKPHIDHCHKTGKIRGLLCNGCNSALGIINENIETLSNLIEYLKCHGSSAEQ